MKMHKNNLDEMQEQKLLRIEHNGLWLGFWGLLIVIIIQVCIGANFKQLIGEWIIFMMLCLYLMICCIKNGIWDRHFKPNIKTNALISLIATFVVCIVYGIAWRGFYQSIKWMVIGLIILGIFIFISFHLLINSF
jgi:uncharacterized membrane protein YjjP (DUF1212 family)